jgi:nanoRNase/pAp phosphatase (c-di-AMP/oligoRNAs hydrolase)
MALTQTEQIKKLIEDKKHVLITFDKNAKGDAIGASLALSLFLQKLGKRVDIVSHGFILPRTFKFLEGGESIASQFSHLQKFIITIDAKDAGVQELSYDVKDEKLRIFVTPKKGFFTKEKLRTAQSDFKYDLIITLGTQDLESLGKLYDGHVELFYKVPVLNIDNNPSNEHYGHVNLIDMTTTTVAEVVLSLLRKIDETLIDEKIATSLLTSIVSKTRSFKADNIKPHTLETASKLIQLGADRDFIVQNLYRTRTVSALKLWGMALTRLHMDNDIGLVWTSVTKDDVLRTSAHKEDIPEIIDELISSSPEAKLTLLLHEEQEVDGPYRVHGIFVTDRGYNALGLMSPFNPMGSENYVTFTIKGTPLIELEKNIRQHLRDELVKK